MWRRLQGGLSPSRYGNGRASENPGVIDMAKGEQRGNREAKKPKKEKIKTIAAAPSQKVAGLKPAFGTDKKK
jgi:hypothetical protein